MIAMSETAGLGQLLLVPGINEALSLVDRGALLPKKIAM
jgi:hypothetical protein